MNIVSRCLDFWLGDFKWYRDLTENDKLEWLCKTENTIYGAETRTWERHPRGTYFMLNIVKLIVKDNPNINSLQDQEQRQIVQKYIDQHYNQN